MTPTQIVPSENEGVLVQGALVATRQAPPELSIPQSARDRMKADAIMRPEQEFRELLAFCAEMISTGFLARAINTPAKAAAIVLTGRELGIGPMLALRSIHIIEGKPSVAADLQLALFKRDGGRCEFRELTEKRAVAWYRHPNGDEHTQTYTIETAQRSKLLGKDNWQKDPSAMLRSRNITAGLKAVGYEPTSGMYDPDEAEQIAESERERSTNGPGKPARARASATARVEKPAPGTGAAVAAAAERERPSAPGFLFRGKYAGVPIDAVWTTADVEASKCQPEDVGYPIISDALLAEADQWARKALTIKPGEKGHIEEPARREKLERFIAGIEAEAERRAKMADDEPESGGQMSQGDNAEFDEP